MQAIILAAGAGRRMWPLSAHCHKGLLAVDGGTALARMVGDLAGIGATPITVVTGYRRDEVEAHLREETAGADLRFVRNDRYAATNNIVSLLLALEAHPPEQDVALLECDVVVAGGLIERLTHHPGRNVALVDRYATGMDGTVVRTRDGIVTELVLPDDQDEWFDYRFAYKTLNVYRFTAAFCNDVLRERLRARVLAGATDEYYEAVLAGLDDLPAHGIVAEQVAGLEWAELDDPHDLTVARLAFEPPARSAILDRARGGHWALRHQDHVMLRNVHFPPPAMVAALRHALPDLLYSYGSTQAVLDEKLSWFLRCPPEAVVALNGGSDAFPLLGRWFAGRRVAVPEPTFGEYARAFPGAGSYRDAPGIDGEELQRAAADHDVLVLVTPNNPTGTTLPVDEILGLAARHTQTTVVVDESFVPFSDQPSVLDATGGHLPANVLVLASLSKSLGVPGLRLGYLAGGDAGLMAALRAEMPIWHLNSVAEHFLELLLKFRPQLAAACDRTKLDRATLASLLHEVDVVADVHVGGGNFVLARLHGPADTAEQLRRALLADARIAVKDVTDRFDDAAPRLRLGVLAAPENRRLVAELARCARLVAA